MSFYDGTLDREKAKKVIETTEKPLRYTYGFSFRNPTTNKKLISKERAIEIINDESFLDITENDEFIHLNAYSDNDMW